MTSPETLFLLNKKAKCKSTKVSEVSLPTNYSAAQADEEHHSSNDHDDNDHAHDEKHKDAKHHHDEKHAHGENHHDEDEHSDEGHSDDNFEISYSFTCTTPKNLRSIEMTSFNTFPAIDYIEAVYLSNTGQKGQRITSKSKVFRLK